MLSLFSSCTHGVSRFLAIKGPRIFLIGLIGSLSACADAGNQGSDDDQNIIDQVVMTPPGPDPMNFDDAACQDQSYGANAVVEASIYEWSSGTIQEFNAPLTAVTSVPFLSSRHITKTSYGLHERLNCEISGSQLLCPRNPKVIAPARPLKICRDRAYFPRTSHETVALSGLYTLNAAYDFHNSLPSHSSQLPATELVVLPRIERSYQITTQDGGRANRISMVTDNLAYHPTYDSGPAFIIYPKSQNSVDSGLWRDLFLWEVPWAMGHEFGHHILRTYALGGNSNLTARSMSMAPGSGPASLVQQLGLNTPPMFDWRRIGFKSSVSGIFGGFMENYAGGIRIIFGNQSNSNSRSVGPTLYWGAINEAFADLYARYTRNSADGQLAGVDCFAKSRDVESPVFGDSTPKVYSPEVHAAFMSTQELDGNRSCDAPDFQGIHSIGAILAHAVNAGIESVTGDVATRRGFGSNQEKSIFKGDILLRWARKMGLQIKSNYPVTLGSFVRDAFVVMAEMRQQAGFPAGELGAGQCQVISSLLPALSADIIGNGGLRCSQ